MSKIICLRDFPDENEANIAKGYLNDNGVESDIFSSGYPLHGPPFDRFRLMINEKDKEKAEKLLEDLT